MNLSDFFQYGNKNTGSHKTDSVRSQAHVTVSGNQHGQQIIRNLMPGQTLQGEIVEKNGNEVQIRLDKDIVITAKLDKDLNISVGQNVIFEVKNNSGTQIALRPLYANLAQDANVLKALEAAKLPITDELMRMVSSMMEQGMSIDKNTLQDMSRLIMMNSGAAPETIVALHNLQIPVTPENIEQFEHYRNYEHQILNSITDILAELPQAFQMMTGGGQNDAAINFYNQILQLFTGSPLTDISKGTAVFTDTASGMNQAVPAESAAAGNPAVALPEADHVLKSVYNQNLKEMTESIMNLTNGSDTETASASGRLQMSGTIANSEVYNQVLLSGVLDENGRFSLANMLGKLGFPQEQLVQIQNGNIDINQLMQDIHNLLSAQGTEAGRADILNLFGSKEYNQLLNNQILQQWLLKPAEVAQKNSVEDFYGRLREQTARLTEALSQVAKDTPLAKSLTVMHNNIDFMNQVNQMFNYLQLPLKMSGGNAHGDLYVYTNRKSTVKEDGSVSALLHLDMEHLGTMDVYVVMKEKNVNTKFYLQHESIIDFIADNIHVLNDRLTQRGYSMTAEMLVNEEQNTNIIETMTAQEKKERILSQYSFDVRA